jgi:hypothetical protein
MLMTDTALDKLRMIIALACPVGGPHRVERLTVRREYESQPTVVRACAKCGLLDRFIREAN